MSRIDGVKAAQESLMEVAKLAIAAAYRAPQITGRMTLQAEIVTGEDLRPIVEFFEAVHPISPVMYFDYCSLKYFLDKKEPLPLVLLGADLTRSELGWDCGACGFATCAEFNVYSKKNKGFSGFWSGPTCNWKLMDYGAACDFACAAVSQYRLEGRILGTVGASASSVGYLPECSAVLGLPIGPVGESNWFNRKQNLDTVTEEQHLENLQRTAPTHFQGFAGSTKPFTKTKNDWWNPMEFLDFRANTEEELKFVEATKAKCTEVSEKHYGKISEWYKKDKK
jgi:uncharacterized ferredoxin-like protein